MDCGAAEGDAAGHGVGYAHEKAVAVETTASPLRPGSKIGAATRTSTLEWAMSYPDLDDARKQHAALLEIVIHNRGGWSDRMSLGRIIELCRTASSAIDDQECRRAVALVAAYAADLFSEQAHQKWDRGSISGADFLRLEILRALHAFNLRLTGIEAARRGPAQSEPGPKDPGSPASKA
jgi:hypothetical protein